MAATPRQALVALGGAVAVACLPRGSATPDGPVVQDRPPAFVALERTCDAEASAWTVTAEVDAWSSGMRSFWSVDGVYAESHRIPVVASAPDGTHDSLHKELPVVDDWREAEDDRATVFTCSQAVATRFVLLDLAGQAVDCRTEGDPSVLDGLDGVPPCDGG